MSRKAPILLETGPLAATPAGLAWSQLGEAPPAVIERWRPATRTKPALYRLTFGVGGPRAVFAKRYPPDGLALERRLYEQVLPGLPLAVPRYRGFCVDREGLGWLFVEDVGYSRLADDDPAQRELAARWLGLLHRSAADLGAGAGLPDAGPGRYLAHLRAGRTGILQDYENRALAPEDREILARLLEQLDEVESRWGEVEAACAGLPATVVHGDFRSKNVRVLSEDGRTSVHVIDWEMAGWGIPAADLAGVSGSRSMVEIDPQAYVETVRERWPDVDHATVRRLAHIGLLFQSLASVEWASMSLRFGSRRYLLKPVTSMRVYGGQIESVFESSPEWLG